MRVILKLFAGLDVHLPGGKSPEQLEFDDGLTILQVLDHLGVPRGVPRILLVNHRHAETHQVLRDGDTLAVFPPVAGG